MCMTPHGPDTDTFEEAIAEEGCQKPAHLPRNTLAFMFEVNYTPRIMPAALALPQLDRHYYKCWVGLKSHFKHPDASAVHAAISNGPAILRAGEGLAIEGAPAENGEKPLWSA